MKKTFFVILTITLVIIAVLIFAEIMLRIFWSGKPHIPKEPNKYPYYPDDDPQISYVLVPNHIYEKGSIKTNCFGFRIAENVKEKKTSGTLRIVFLGDSLVLGTGALDRKTITSVLQKGFEILKNGKYDKAEVLNLGIPGHNPKQYLAVLKKYGLRYHPDIILVGISIFNDLDGKFVEYLGNGYLTRKTEYEVHGINYYWKPPSWLEWNSYLLRFFYYLRQEIRRKNKTEEDQQDTEEIIKKYLPASCDGNDKLWADLKSIFNEIALIAQREKAYLKILIFPSTAQIVYRDLPRTPQNILLKILKGLKIPAKDFSNDFDHYYKITGTLPYRDKKSHPDDWMYNFIAFILRDDIAKEFFGRPENEFKSEIDIGDKGDVKYLSFGWGNREKLGNTGFRWIVSAKARIVFNDFAKEIKGFNVKCLAFEGCAEQNLAFSLNGIELAPIKLNKTGKPADYKVVFKNPIRLQEFNIFELKPACAKRAPGDADSTIITPRNISVAVDKIIFY